MNAVQYIAVIGGWDDRLSKVSMVEVVSILDEGVVSSSTCQSSELEVAFAAISGNLICGGKNPEERIKITNECKELNPESFKWTERSPMKKKRINHAMTTANNQTRYVCGGDDEFGTRLKSCEKFDREWSFIKDLPIPLNSHCMIGTEDSIYAIGGYDGSGVSE